MSWRERWREWRESRAEFSDSAEEMRLHIDLETERNIRNGMTPAEARRRAALAFGGVDRFAEQARDERSGVKLSDFVVSTLDFKLGYRMLRRYPGLTLVGGLAMALAIAVGASGFEGVLQLVRPRLPFPDGDRVVAIRNWDVKANRVQPRSAHDFVSWQAEARTVRELGAYRLFERNLIVPGRGTESVSMAEISAVAFTIAGVRPVLGRVLIEADERANAPLVAVIGHDVWQARFDADPAVIGRTVAVGPARATIVGVMPEGFAFPLRQSLWLPLRLNALEYERGAGPALGVFGRLVAGATVAEAQAELGALGQRVARDYPATHENLRTQVMPFVESIFPFRMSTLYRAIGLSANLFFVAFLLLICANVALLMFARAAARESEIVVRNALGASRARIVTQLVAEALVLASCAAALGLPTAGLILRSVKVLMEGNAGRLPFWVDASLSPPSVAYALGLALLGALVAGSLPALKVTKGLGTRLRQIGAGGGGLRFGGVWTVVIIAQVALTVVMVFMTAYIIQRAARVRALEYGFAAEQYLSTRLVADREIANLPYEEGVHGWAESDAGFRAKYAELERRLEAESGVLGVTFANVVPGMYHLRGRLQIDSALASGAKRAWQAQRASVGVDFFDVLGTPPLSGRNFNSADLAADRRVVIVNQSFVRTVLGERNAVGQRVRFAVDDSREPWGPWFEIVGVVPDLAMSIDRELGREGVYFPVEPAERAHLIVHVRGRGEGLAPRVRSIAASVDPGLRLHELGALENFKKEELRFFMIAVRVMVGASILVLALSLAGIYAIMSFTVARRTREIGIRLALGADRRRLVTTVFARPLAQAVSGIFIAEALLLIVSENVGWRILFILAAFSVTMLVVVMSACIVPVRRALRIEPSETLRAET